MFDGKIHGTDCFEVESFLQKNGSSKIYQVRHKASGEFYTMEVSPRGASSEAPVSPYIQETTNVFSKFWLNLRFTFQTRSKFYYILDSAGTQTLSQLVKSSGCLSESAARFYASEVLVSLEEFHRARLVYKELALDSVCLDSDGHVIMWRSFCDKLYWSKLECVCSLGGFRHGDPCNNNHDFNVDFKQDWVAFGHLLSAMLAGESYGHTTTHYSNSKQATVLPSSLSASASDLIRRLVRGEISHSEQILSHPFFGDVDWREVRNRNARAPRFPLNLRTEQVQSSANSPSSNSSYYRQQYNAPVPSSLRWRPQSSALQSDPADLRSNESAPNYLVPRPSLHSTLSSPDLSSWCQMPPTLQRHVSLPASSTGHHLEATDYASTNEAVTKRPASLSRSLSDIAGSAGSYAVFGLQSPALLQRTFENPNFHGTHLSGGTQDLRICDSSFAQAVIETDLSGNRVPWCPPYYGPHSERSSPTPSQYSDYSSHSSYSPDTSPRRPFDSPLVSPRSSISDSFSSTKQNGGALEYQTFQRSSSRESDDDREIPDFPIDHRRREFSFHSSETRPIDNSGPRSEMRKNRSSAQQNVLANATKEGLESICRDEISGRSDEFGRERTVSLSRTLSCSVLGDWNQSSSDRRDSLPLDGSGPRERYPLAQLPIPSFREFKNRNSSIQTEGDFTSGKDKPSQDNPDGTAEVVSKQDEKRESESNGKNRLSSLYESAKDICGHTKTKPLSRSGKYLNVPNELKADAMERKLADAPEGSKSTRKYSKSRHDSPFSKNEVIHQLMLKYGLYEKSGHRQTKSPTNETKIVRVNSGGSGVKEKRNVDLQSPPSRSKLSPRSVTEKETLSSSFDSSATKSPRSSRATDKTGQRSPHKVVESTNQERRKSASEILEELRQKNRFIGETTKPLDSPTDEVQSKMNKSNLQHGNGEKNAFETASSEKDEDSAGDLGSQNSGNRSPSNENRGNELDSKMVDILKERLVVIRNRSVTKETVVDKSDDINNNSGNSPRSMYGTSRTVLCAAKFKRARNKAGITPTSSPLPEKKNPEKIVVSNDASADVTNCQREETVVRPKETSDTESIEIKNQSSIDQPSPSRDHRRLCVDKGLRKSGIHTSMLNIASSFWSRDTDMDDNSSIGSEIDLVEGGRGTRGRRWDSFYSNTSADSGSAQMFEYETDWLATEYDDQEYRDDRHKGEVDVERADSGVGGDMGQSPMRRSWEEIMMKSSEHWSVVAASARHWKDFARRRKVEASGPRSPKKKSSFTITEDMVECPDCLKYYLPQTEKETEDDRSPEICNKCKDRRVERKEAIIELVQTEINYGNDLQVLKEEFYIPIQSGGILSPDNLAAMFLNLQELLEVNSKFCAKLQKSLEHSVAIGDEEFTEVNVGSIFLESVDFFQAYEIYCSKQNAASALLDSLQKKTELLRIFLNVTCRENPKCRKMDLNSFILAPVQRIMKYPLLLSRICKASPRTNADREKLKMAQRKIEEQLNKINALNTTVESRQRRYRTSQQLGRSDSLDKVQMKKMASDILNWTIEEMQLLMHGVFQVNIHEFGTSWNRRGSKKALSVCVLFCVRGHSEHIRIDSDEEGDCDEPLFPGEGEVTGASLVLLRKKTNGKYTLFKDPLPLDMCVVYRDCGERKDSFELMLIGKESYVFKATSARECRRWLKYLRTESKNLGAWKRRRNGLPNIMIKSL